MHCLPQKLESCRCRIYQAGVKIGNYLIGYRTPPCLEGPGVLDKLPELCIREKLDHILIVTGASLLRRGMLNSLLEAMEREKINYTIFAPEKTDPDSTDVQSGWITFKQHGCRAIVALGGGSRIDCAKAIAAKAARPEKSVSELQGLLKVRKTVPPLIAVPTTAGTGSETTLAAVIVDAATHRKASINDPCLMPRYAVLDPLLTVGMPPFLTAITGMDALTHAVEAYTNHRYNTKIENHMAKEAVCLIHDNLLKAYQNGSDLNARQNMQKGAFLAGRAFTRGCVGYVHAVGHTLGSLYGVAHGLAMAVLLPHVMHQYGFAVHRRLAELADVCGIQGKTDAEKAEGFLSWIQDTCRIMEIPDRIDGIRQQDVDRMISWAMKEANPLYPVPVIWGREDFRKLIQKIM